MQFDSAKMFTALMHPQALSAVFKQRMANSTAKGVDRINGFQFSEREAAELTIASGKLLAGLYRFSPYLEILRPRGHDRKPRVISIPTIRDRVVLHQLKELLSGAFPEHIPRNIAGSIVRDLAKDLTGRDPNITYVCGCDIRDFYGSLDQKRLLATTSKRITDTRAAKLLMRAILTPTVPSATKRVDHLRYRRDIGVPQGLAISNILAAIYIADVDIGMSGLPVKYYRYVDDVLMVGDEAEVRLAQKSFVARARYRRLSVHAPKSGKSHLSPLTARFGYLGYVFQWPAISVRESTVERLLQSIAAKFTNYRYNKDRQLARHKYLDIDQFKAIFLFELNEKITGAISEERRYGWVAYFSQITDLTLLHKLDAAVRSMFERMPDFGSQSPPGLRSFARAYFEMKYRPHGGYVRDFDSISTPMEKLKFLLERGRVAPDDALTMDQIESRFVKYRHEILGAMQADEGNMY